MSFGQEHRGAVRQSPTSLRSAAQQSSAGAGRLEGAPDPFLAEGPSRRAHLVDGPVPVAGAGVAADLQRDFSAQGESGPDSRDLASAVGSAPNGIVPLRVRFETLWKGGNHWAEGREATFPMCPNRVLRTSRPPIPTAETFPMNMTPWLATLALGLALVGCQESASTSSNPVDPGIGGIALGFSARTLDTLRQDSDSLLLTLAGPLDTIRSISRLGDTLRFEGLRTGSWLLSAEVFSSESGARQRTWEGSANAWVQPGRLARVSLVLRRATGSLVVDVRLDDGPDIYEDSCWRGSVDTTCLYYPPSDTIADTSGQEWPVGATNGVGFPLTPSIPSSWSIDTIPWVIAPTSRSFDRFLWSVPRILDWTSERGYLQLRAYVPGGNSIPWVTVVEDESCEVAAACPLRLKLFAKIPAGGIVDSFALRAATLRVDLSAFEQARTKGVILVDDSRNIFLVSGLQGSWMGACDRPAGSGLVSCPDTASIGIRYRPAL